jgi:hypothetical protein
VVLEPESSPPSAPDARVMSPIPSMDAHALTTKNSIAAQPRSLPILAPASIRIPPQGQSRPVRAQRSA